MIETVSITIAFGFRQNLNSSRKNLMEILWMQGMKLLNSTCELITIRLVLGLKKSCWRYFLTSGEIYLVFQKPKKKDISKKKENIVKSRHNL